MNGFFNPWAYNETQALSDHTVPPWRWWFTRCITPTEVWSSVGLWTKRTASGGPKLGLPLKSSTVSSSHFMCIGFHESEQQRRLLSGENSGCWTARFEPSVGVKGEGHWDTGRGKGANLSTLPIWPAHCRLFSGNAAFNADYRLSWMECRCPACCFLPEVNVVKKRRGYQGLCCQPYYEHGSR